MTGRVRLFIPAVGQGILQTESGEEWVFRVAEGVARLQGGDIVQFDLVPDGRPLVSNVTLQHRWAEMLNEQHRPLVNQFHHTVRICT